MVAEDIILAPVVTEKSNSEMQSGKYTFKVANKATKVDVKNAEKKNVLAFIQVKHQIGKKLLLQ